MQLKFEHFGPISSGTLDLKPLTILIGDNQAGKSFAAMAAHAVIRALSMSSHRSGLFYYGPFSGRRWGASKGVRRLGMQASQENELPLESLLKRVQAASVNECIKLTNRERGQLEQLTPVGAQKEALRASLEDVFSVPTKQLISNGSDNGFVRISEEGWSAQISLKKGRISSSADIQSGKSIAICYADRRRKDFETPANCETIIFKPASQARHKSYSAFIEDLYPHVNKLVPDQADMAFLYSFYIPAIRSGLLLSHRLFLSLLVRNVHRAGLEPFSVPQMTGVTADFLESLLLRPDEASRSGKWFDFISDYERLIAGGTVYFKYEQDDQIPSLYYKTSRGLDIPLNLTSSTVQEVAPLFLLLRSLRGAFNSKVKAWVIIEEPESHLSPRNQIGMARFLATLVNKGFHIVMTTHSSFLMEQINNFIVSSSIEGSSESALHPSQVSAHYARLVRPGESVLEPLEVSAADGVNLESFTDVYAGLYEEGFKIRGARGDSQ